MNDSGIWVFIGLSFLLGFCVGGQVCDSGWRRNIKEEKVSLVISTNVVTNVVKEIVVK